MGPTRLLVLSTLCAACAANGGTPPPKEFDGKQALAYVAAQLAFGPRIPGTPGHAAEAAWLDSLTHAKADTVIVQRWWHHTSTGDSIQLTNVIARFNVKATKRVLYLAHWDTRPKANSPSSKDFNAPVPGANDGASGVAILLGVMDALKKVPPTGGVDLLFEDGEDYGVFGGPDNDHDVMLGARYYAEHQVTSEKPMFALLFDMVGDKDLKIPIETGSQVAAPEVVDTVWSIAERMGYGHVFVKSTQGVKDDHVPLIEAGIPTVDIIDFTYPPWHTADDTIDKVSAESLEIVGNVAVAVLRHALRL